MRKLSATAILPSMLKPSFAELCGHGGDRRGARRGLAGSASLPTGAPRPSSLLHQVPPFPGSRATSVRSLPRARARGRWPRPLATAERRTPSAAGKCRSTWARRFCTQASPCSCLNPCQVLRCVLACLWCSSTLPGMCLMEALFHVSGSNGCFFLPTCLGWAGLHQALKLDTFGSAVPRCALLHRSKTWTEES